MYPIPFRPIHGVHGEQVTVALWKDGFTVEIGEDADPPALRKGDVPENAQFMEDLKAG